MLGLKLNHVSKSSHWCIYQMPGECLQSGDMTTKHPTDRMTYGALDNIWWQMLILWNSDIYLFYFLSYQWFLRVDCSCKYIIRLSTFRSCITWINMSWYYIKYSTDQGKHRSGLWINVKTITVPEDALASQALMKLFIHSQTSAGTPLRFGNG